jgi:hypothetical protein
MALVKFARSSHQIMVHINPLTARNPESRSFAIMRREFDTSFPSWEVNN